MTIVLHRQNENE